MTIKISRLAVNDIVQIDIAKSLLDVDKSENAFKM